ncbi:MAG: HNH endonuclease [Actinomycetota bacterium]|nr:HNH endonuclease [Actinomycetota bacterium]
MGRATRTVTAAQRRAIAVRDRGCRFPGCHRPLSWCDIHHIVHWANLGPTDLDNLLPLCRYHHTLVHEHGFAITGTATQPRFHRPDGTVLDNRSPPWR